MSEKILNWFGLYWKRARDSKGRYVKDNKETKFFNEAWKLVYKPTKK